MIHIKIIAIIKIAVNEKNKYRYIPNVSNERHTFSHFSNGKVAAIYYTNMWASVHVCGFSSVCTNFDAIFIYVIKQPKR